MEASDRYFGAVAMYRGLMRSRMGKNYAEAADATAAIEAPIVKNTAYFNPDMGEYGRFTLEGYEKVADIMEAALAKLIFQAADETGRKQAELLLNTNRADLAYFTAKEKDFAPVHRNFERATVALNTYLDNLPVPNGSYDKFPPGYEELEAQAVRAHHWRLLHAPENREVLEGLRTNKLLDEAKLEESARAAQDYARMLSETGRSFERGAEGLLAKIARIHTAEKVTVGIIVAAAAAGTGWVLHEKHRKQHTSTQVQDTPR